MKVDIRKGRVEDVEQALNLVKKLAEFEKAPFEVTVTKSEMEAWGFGSDKQFDFFVAELQGQIVGIAVYYFKYSTWKGKCLFLEDIIVDEPYRGYKIGFRLFEAVKNVAHELKVGRMEWQVLNWNESAIEFYKKWDTVFDDEWLNCKINNP